MAGWNGGFAGIFVLTLGDYEGRLLRRLVRLILSSFGSVVNWLLISAALH